ncbi:DUF2252 family protein [Sphingosinithalassobacter portus]|uniref:DUF2252 family protein n=1 Tax=Stakelama portus TaxID=2676234 RepID=UPI000D6E2E51|nr:DUF2252 family protein [Sphingosinithalassobacter portus]
MDDGERSAWIAAEIARVDGIAPDAGSHSAKHAKMARNPYCFLRGSAQLIYGDLASGALHLPQGLTHPALYSAVVGDCHMSNFGFVTEKGSHGRHIIFGPDDFDDACIGPAAWDLARFVTSLFLSCELAAGIAEGRYTTDEFDDVAGLAPPEPDEALAGAQAFVDRYIAICDEVTIDPAVRRRTLDDFAIGHPLRRFLKKARKRAIGGAKFERKSSLGKAVAIDPAGLRFRDRRRYRRLDEPAEAAVRAAFRPYVDDAILDVVRRIGQGTGSLDLPRYYLLVGPEGAATSAELTMCQVVEVKQQRRAAPLHEFPDLDPRNTLGPAHLTVMIQRRVQREPDLLLDQADWDGESWLVRSRHHARVSAEPEEICLSDGDAGIRLAHYAQACGEALALAHSRADNRSVRFETAMGLALRQDGAALIEAARSYAERVIADWELYCAMRASGG